MLVALALLGAAPPAAWAQDRSEPREPDARARELLARRALEDGRALRLEGRLDAAERVLLRGLEAEPEHPPLLRALAHVLDAEDRGDEARALRERADALDPPPPPLPDAPLAHAGGSTLVLLVPGGEGQLTGEPGHWPGDEVERALSRRLAIRLPGASLLRADPESVAEVGRLLDARDAARALSLRIDRADCRFSIKDGVIGVAELRFAAAARGGSAPAAERAKAVVFDPPPEDCPSVALGRALEQVFAGDAWRDAAGSQPVAGVASAAGVAGPWQDAARELFPGIGHRIARSLQHGESLLRAGRLGDALAVFEQAREIDPRDPEVLAQLDDTRQSLALAREIAATGEPDEEATALDPRLSAGQRAAAEVALAREQRRRDDLLSALAVLDEDLRAPPPELLRTLRVSEIREPDAFAPRLARQRAGGAVAARTAYAPDGSVLARYYFAAGSMAPLVREEDTDGDGQPDRWIAYRDGARGEIYEDARGRGLPDRRLVFAEGGEPLQRIELDLSGDGKPERVFRYEDGDLHAEESDTDGDGRLDRFDRFGSDGRVDLREEDLDGDGAIDVRSVYRAGKLVRREITSPEHAPES